LQEDAVKISEQNLQEISSRLRKSRLKLNLTYEAVCSRTSLSIQTVKNAEDGKHDFSISTLMELAKCYGISTDYILGFKPEHIDDSLMIQISKLTLGERGLLNELLRVFTGHSRD